MLTALGYNIRKLFRYFKGENPFKYWVPSVELEPEKKTSYKRLNKKATKSKAKSVNQKLSLVTNIKKSCERSSKLLTRFFHSPLAYATYV